MDLNLFVSDEKVDEKTIDGVVVPEEIYRQIVELASVARKGGRMTVPQYVGKLLEQVIPAAYVHPEFVERKRQKESAPTVESAPAKNGNGSSGRKPKGAEATNGGGAA